MDVRALAQAEYLEKQNKFASSLPESICWASGHGLPQRVLTNGTSEFRYSIFFVKQDYQQNKNIEAS